MSLHSDIASVIIKNKKCKYCQFESKKNASKIISTTDLDVKLYKSNNSFVVEFMDDGYGMQSELIKFNNCPMCGRELEGADSNE